MPRRFPEFAWRGVLLTALLATQCTPAGSPPERRAAPPPDAATARSFAPPQSHSASERSAPRRQPGQQLGQSVRERSDAYELAWSLARKGEALTLDIKLVAREELYVADRLWDSDQAGRRVPDPRGVYRFVRDGSLRLVFAQAPRPPNVAVRIVFAPLYSRVRAGEAHQRTIQLGLPVDEYSALGRDTSAPSAVEEVSKVLLVLAYRTRSSMKDDPTPPPRETAEQAGYIVHDPQLIVSAMEVEALPVKRRTGYLARFALPGEPGPEPIRDSQ